MLIEKTYFGCLQKKSKPCPLILKKNNAAEIKEFRNKRDRNKGCILI